MATAEQIIEKLLANQPWMPAGEVRAALQELREAIGKLGTVQQRNSERIARLEENELIQAKRWEKWQEQMDEMLGLARDIKSSVRIANGVAKFVAWSSGVVLALIGFWLGFKR